MACFIESSPYYCSVSNTMIRSISWVGNIRIPRWRNAPLYNPSSAAWFSYRKRTTIGEPNMFFVVLLAINNFISCFYPIYKNNMNNNHADHPGLPFKFPLNIRWNPGLCSGGAEFSSSNGGTKLTKLATFEAWGATNGKPQGNP